MFNSHQPSLSFAGVAPPAMALFRDPRQRLVAAYNDGQHKHGFHSPQHVFSNFSEFLSHPSIRNCQTKMLLGDADEKERKKREREKKRKSYSFSLFVPLPL
jgi:hypothetical protein